MHIHSMIKEGFRWLVKHVTSMHVLKCAHARNFQETGITKNICHRPAYTHIF